MSFHIIKHVKILGDMRIEATFNNEEKRIYDIKSLIKKHKNFKKLEDEVLFNKVKVDIGYK